MKRFLTTTSLFLTLSLTAAHAGDEMKIHPDCKTSTFPEVCTRMVNQIIGELTFFNEVFANGGSNEAAQAAEFYHPLATLYTNASGRFYIGRQDIERNFFVPFVAVIKTAKVNFESFHYSVIDFETVVAYGSLTANGTFKDGTTFMQPPLPQTVTFVRNARYDAKRPFLIISDHE